MKRRTHIIKPPGIRTACGILVRRWIAVSAERGRSNCITCQRMADWFPSTPIEDPPKVAAEAKASA